MAFRPRDRAGRLTAALLGALVLQLTAVTHLHLAHQSGGVVASVDGDAVSRDGTIDEHSPSCPLCLLRAQTYTFASTRIATAPLLGVAQQPAWPAERLASSSRCRGPAAPRGPPSSFA